MQSQETRYLVYELPEIEIQNDQENTWKDLERTWRQPWMPLEKYGMTGKKGEKVIKKFNL